MRTLLISILLFISLYSVGQIKWRIQKEIILPSTIQICRFTYDRFSANYYIGNTYRANIYIMNLLAAEQRGIS